MPRYQITAPDGRVVLIEGSSPPTDADAEEIFASLPAKVAAPAATVAASAREFVPTPVEDAGLDFFIKEAGLAGMAPSNQVSPRSAGALVDMGMEGGGATAGQMAGALTGPLAPVAIPVLGGIGGGAGNYAAQKRRIAAGEQEGFRTGELLSSIFTSAIPGGPLAASGPRAVVREGSKQAAAGLIGKNIQTAIDEGRVANPVEGVLSTVIPAAGGAVAQRIQAANPAIQSAVADAAASKTVKARTLDAAKELGATITPSDVTDSWFNKRLESIAGPADIRRGAAIKNQELVNRVAAEELRLPAKTEITIPVLKGVRDKAAAPYREIESISTRAKNQIAEIERVKFTATDPHELAIQMADPATVAQLEPLKVQAKADIKGLRTARELMNDNRPPYPQPDADKLALFRKTAEVVDQMEADIEAAALAAGRTTLVDELRDARTLIAKSHDIEKSLNIGDANVSLPILGRMLDRAPGRMSGDLETMGKFAEAFPRNVTEGARTQPFGLSKTEVITGGGLATGAALATGSPYALLGAVVPPLLSTGARRLALSGPYQRAVANLPEPRINATPDQIAAAIRLLAQSAGSNEEAAKFFQAPTEPMLPATTLSRP